MKENFLEDYLKFQQTAMLKEFAGLSEDDLKQINLLKSGAAKIYQNIVESRQIGADYLYAAFTYFSVYLSRTYALSFIDSLWYQMIFIENKVINEVFDHWSK